jgi:hypothetical protein
MTIEQIEKFLDTKNTAKGTLKIDFKTRRSIVGLFVKLKDYDELKEKNFWRVVSGDENLKNWKETSLSEFAKIVSGTEITKLSLT